MILWAPARAEEPLATGDLNAKSPTFTKCGWVWGWCGSLRPGVLGVFWTWTLVSGDWGANLPPVATRITCGVELFWAWKRDGVELFWAWKRDGVEIFCVWTMDCTILPLEILRPVSPFSLLVLNSLLRLYSTCLCFLVKSGDMKIPLWAAVIEDRSLRALWSIDLLLSRLSNEIIMRPLFPIRCTLLIFTLPVISSTGSSSSDCNKSRSDIWYISASKFYFWQILDI